MASSKETSPGEFEPSEIDVQNSEVLIRQEGAISEEDLAKQLQDKELARTLTEIAKAQKIAAIYIDKRSGGVFFGGEAHISGDVVGHDQTKRQPSDKHPSDHVEAVSHALINDLAKIISVFVPPSTYKTASKILKDRHLLIIYGRAHLGKLTSALFLLHEVHDDNLSELDPAANLDTLNFKNTSPHGYVIDTISTERAEKFSLFVLNKLSSQLQTCQSHMVITVDERASIPRESLNQYIVVWDDFPEQNAVLDKHLDWYAVNNQLREKAASFLDEDDFRTLFTQSLPPGDVDRLAQLLTEAASEKITLADALDRFEARAGQQVATWFEEHTDIDDRALLLATAVFNGASFQIITSAEKQLLSLLPEDQEKKNTASSVLGGLTRTQRLQRVGAKPKPGYEDTEFGQSPVDVVELNNPAIQPAILHHTWKELDRFREILVKWLHNLVIDKPYEMRIRAAAAAGELSKYDFTYICREILKPWGIHPDTAVRASAAYALGIPAWESEKAPLVLNLLHHWSTLDNWRLCWTAAVAYGGLVGIRFPDAALRDLYRIAQTGDLRLIGAITKSITNLFITGELVPDYRKKVLDTLVYWTEKPKQFLTTLGLFVFIQLAATVRTKADPEADTWPTLLWLIKKDENIQPHILTLWRRSLNLKPTRHDALLTLRDWLLDSTEDARLYENLVWLCKEIITTGEERESERLLGYLNRWKEQNDTAQVATKILDMF